MSDACGPSPSESTKTAALDPLDAPPAQALHNGLPDELPPLDDPYLNTPVQRAELSTLAVSSVVVPLLLGPLGAVAGIVFGWAARREIEEAPERRSGYTLATVGLALGVVLTTAWGAGLSLLAWMWTYHRGADVVEQQREAASEVPTSEGAAAPAQSPQTDPPGGRVPPNTRPSHVGALTIVDIGVDTLTLREELAKQRAEAYALGEKVLVMTTRDPCDPCRGVDRSLADPLMQTALRGVRLVRVDIDVFKEDLDQLKMPRNRYPAFFLLSLDLTPQDGIDGGEWDEDIPRNIAPVLGAFVRGQYSVRHEPWKPLPGSGVRL